MAATLTCPVCERPGVPLESTTCPQCDADLTCFQALDILTTAKKSPSSGPAGEEASEEKQKNASSTRRAVLLLLLLLVLIGAGFSCFFLKAEGRMQDLYQQVVSLKAELRMAQQQETEPAQQILCVLPGMEKASVEVDKEDDSFAEDDPLIYEEDREEAASATEESKEEATFVASSPQIKTEGKSETEETLASGETTREVNQQTGEGESDTSETVTLLEPVLRKTRTDTLGEDSTSEGQHASHASHASQPLLPEKKWAEKSFLYLVKETDTLWDLAERFYGNGKYYPVIMEQNPRLIISNIHDEESLRLFNDRSALKELYSSRIEWRDGLTLWKHQVQAGETRQSIEKRFASPGDSDRVFYKRKPDISPGAIVRVILH